MRDAYTGQPIAGAVVRLGEATWTTDASGQFRFPRWRDDQSLEASAGGYALHSLPLAGHRETARAATTPVALDVQLRPDTLAGIVTNAYTGEPVAGATVVVGTLQASTGADGRYALAGIPAEASAIFRAPGFAEQTRSLTRTTSLDAQLRPDTLAGIVRDTATGAPVAGAVVSFGEISARTGDDGRYALRGVPAQGTLVVAAQGYAEQTVAVARQVVADITLQPTTVQAALVDATTGEPVTHATILVTPQPGARASSITRIDGQADGRFELVDVPLQGYLEVLAPGYRKATLAMTPGAMPERIELEPFVVRGVYITAAMAARMERVQQYFDLIDRTELNAIVIDVKSDLRDDLGLIYYDSQVPIVRELGTARAIMPIREILAEAKRRGIYTIARVHIFSHDNVLADARPDWAARNRTTGEVFADYPTPTIRYAWLDPWNEHVWDYNIQLSVEAAGLGFDEINFDYIRFPSLEFDPRDKERLQLSRENATDEDRFQNIVTMLERAHTEINAAGAFLSVDVFGYTTHRPSGLIGQDIGRMAHVTDYVMPMVYPSHYVPGELGFANPAEYPYEIVLDSLQRGARQMDGKRAHLRPWLQDFTLTWVPEPLIVEYGPDEVRAQINAVADFDARTGWVLYDSANRYTEPALRPAEAGQ